MNSNAYSLIGQLHIITKEACAGEKLPVYKLLSKS